MKTAKWIIIAFLIYAAASLVFVMPADALSMNAGMSIGDGFKTAWTNKNPNLASVTS